MLNFGKVRPGSTLYIPFDSFAGSTGASITLTGLAVTDIEIYKDGGTTQRASDNGYTLLDTDGIDFDGLTGIHGFSISLADNSTAGFYAAGSRYFVVVSSVTIDSQTVSFVAAAFEIGYPDSVFDTTIATLSTQTSFTLTAGPAEDDALNGCMALLHDVASAVQCGFALVQDYTGASKTVTLAAGTTFTAAATDNISFYPPALLPTVLGRTVGVEANGKVTGVVLTDTVTTYTGNTPQTGDSFARLGAPAGASVSADIAAIEAQTDDIGAAGAGLSAIPWNANWDAEVESEVTDALTAFGASTLTAAEANAEVDTALADVGLTTTITGRIDAAVSTRATPAQILTTALTEAYAADGAAPTLSQLLFLVLAALTEFAISGTTISVKKLDGTTEAATYTLDDDTNPTSRTRAT